jgi:alginate O-acetyltransferase complex protein AlgI
VQLPQIERPRARPSADRVRSGLLLILIGLFKKIAIADMLAPFVDDAFRTAGHTSAIGLLIGIYAFALQIYGDFSGYSDIARGSSRLFGIELLRNFEQPYLSRSITAFWRTWHISLSTWLRDYLYIPLGGNKRGGLRTYRNLMLTMLLGGLWHGAAWTFVVWGGLHGLYLSVHRRLGGRRDPLPSLDEAVDPRTPEADYEVRAPHTAPPPRFGWRRDLLPALGTFHLVCLAWIFFRADSFHQAITYLGGILSLRGGPIRSDAALMLLVAAIIVATIDILQRNRGGETPMLSWRPVARGVVYAAFVIAIIIFSGGTSVPFIYFQF